MVFLNYKFLFIFTLFIVLLFVLPFLIELMISLTKRRWHRQEYFTRAEARSKAVGKPLLVVGDPDTGCINYYLGRDYGCGDVCLDLTGAPACLTSIKGDLVENLKKMSNNKYVIFVSCTLEYLPNLEQAITELERVSGTSDDLFIVTVEPYSPLHFLFSGSQNIILDAPPNAKKISFMPIPKLYRQLQKLYGPLTRSNMTGIYKKDV